MFGYHPKDTIIVISTNRKCCRVVAFLCPAFPAIAQLRHIVLFLLLLLLMHTNTRGKVGVQLQKQIQTFTEAPKCDLMNIITRGDLKLGGAELSVITLLSDGCI